MLQSRIASEVTRVISEMAPSADVASLPAIQRFAEPPLGLDSLDTLQLLQDVSGRLGIEFSEHEDLTKLVTLGSLIERLEALVAEQTQEEP